MGSAGEGTSKITELPLADSFLLNNFVVSPHNH